MHKRDLRFLSLENLTCSVDPNVVSGRQTEILWRWKDADGRVEHAAA